MTRQQRMPFVLAIVALVLAGTTGPAGSASHAWTITPHRKASDRDVLLGVSCPTATRCVAVGAQGTGDSLYGGTASLAEHWSGDHWSVVSTPNPSGAAYVSPNAVDCPTPTSCFAVGSYTSGDTWNHTLA